MDNQSWADICDNELPLDIKPAKTLDQLNNKPKTYLSIGRDPYGECCGSGYVTYVFQKIKISEHIKCLGSSVAKGKLCPVCMIINSPHHERLKRLDIRLVDSDKNLLCVKIKGERISSLYNISYECNSFLHNHPYVKLDIFLDNSNRVYNKRNEEKDNQGFIRKREYRTKIVDPNNDFIDNPFKSKIFDNEIELSDNEKKISDHEISDNETDFIQNNIDHLDKFIDDCLNTQEDKELF